MSDHVLEANELDEIVAWSPEAERLFGWNAAEAQGRVADLLVAPESRVEYRAWARRARELPSSCALVELDAVRKDGSRFPVLFKLLADAGPGRLLSVRRLLEDAREPSTTASGRALLDEKEFLAAVLDNMVEGVVACDSRGVVCVVNHATRLFYGLPDEHVPAEEWARHFDVFAADGVTPLVGDERPLRRAFLGERLQDFEIVIAPKQRAPRRILANGQPIFDARGRKLGAVLSLHDVTGQRAAETKLRHHQALLQYIVDFLPHAIFWKDREARFLGGNRAFLEALRVSSLEEMVGRTDNDFFPADQADRYRERDFAVMASGRPMLDVEEPLDRGPAGVRVLVTSKVPLRDERGDVIGLLGSFSDITDRKRMERDLEVSRNAAEAAARAKSEFLTTVSHELRTPLTLILGPLEAMLGDTRGDFSPEVREKLERIRRNASRLHVLVSDVLDFTKIESGKAQVSWEDVDVPAVVRDVVDDAMLAARQKRITLSFTADRDLGPIPLDHGKLEKIVLNLVGNAIKFTPAGGRIDVAVRAVGDELELSVTDTGIGIAPAQQKLLFLPFQQLDSSAARRHEGTGIGLALVKEFAELMGGQVGAESAVGRGSRFSVRFARTADQATLARVRPSAPEPAEETLPSQRLIAKHSASTPTDMNLVRAAPETAPRVLVVEDNADMRAYIGEVLEGAYRTTIATNGAAALAAAEADRPDLIVTDIMMPDMDGLELLARLKRDEALRRIPVILLTARAGREDLVAGLNAGADDYVTKPFVPAELLARVHAAWRLRRSQLELEAALTLARESQEKLVQSAKLAAVGTLVAGISHELNNPLSAIGLNLEALTRWGLRDPALVPGIVSSMERQLARCAHLVRTMLDFSRKEPRKTEPVAPRELFSRVETLAAPLARSSGVELAIDVDVPHTMLRVSIQELETALLNLITNALDATPLGGSVRVVARPSARDGAPGVLISVIDTGSGIPEEVLARVFEPFFTTKPPGSGTGLGLALTRSVIESHRGTIAIRSLAGRGTTVDAWLPVELRNDVVEGADLGPRA